MTHIVSRNEKNDARRLGRTVGIALWAFCVLQVDAGPIDEWQQAKNLDTCAAYQAYAAKYPDNQISPMARDHASERCVPATPPPEPQPTQGLPSSPSPPSTSATDPAATTTSTPPTNPPPQSSSDGRTAVAALVDAYYAALSRADAPIAAQMWLTAPPSIRWVPDNEYCNLHRRDVTDFDSYRAVVAVDVTCKSRGEQPRLYEVNLTLEHAGGQWKIRTLELR